MKLLKIDLNNWGPFFGDHSINLDVSESSPVVVIHGENGRGKTSLMRSIYWCLYGSVKDGFGTVMPIEKLVNRDCVANTGTANFAVEIAVLHDDREYVIRREGIATSNPDGLVTDSIQFSVRPQGEHPLSESKAIELVSSILEEAIAEFYLFDGEKLAAAEKKLSRNDSESHQFVQKSVERALGLSFADRLRGDLESVRSDYSNALAGHTKLLQETEKLLQRKLAVEKDLNDFIADRERVIFIKGDQERTRSEIQARLQEFDLVRDKVVARQLLVEQLATDQVAVDSLKADLRHEAETSWFYPLASTLALNLQSLETEYESAKTTSTLAKALATEIQYLKSNLAGHKCTLCGSGLADSAKGEIELEIERKQTELDSLPGADPIQISDKIQKLSSFRSKSQRFPILEKLLEEVAQAEFEISAKKSQVKELAEQIGTTGTPDILALEEERDLAVTRISDAAKLLVELEERIREAKSNLQGIQVKVKNSPEFSPLERNKLELVDQLERLLSDSYDEFRENMRKQVQTASTNILKRLSTEEAYTQVAISTKYQVAMLDSEGLTVPNPSSGYSQILALSFIGGLADVAAAGNAVVMDTPWGRVDRGNRKLIIQWIKERKNQTIIFVQSGELTLEEARDQLGNKLGRQLVLERISATATKLVEV